MNLENKPIIAVIGATGAQGRPVIKHLLRDGAYKVKALTRNASHPRAQSLLSLGQPGQIELVTVSVSDVVYWMLLAHWRGGS